VFKLLIADERIGSATTALASRCEQLTAGPLGPLDNVVSTFDQGCIGSAIEPKYHLRFTVNRSRNFLNFLSISRTDFRVFSGISSVIVDSLE